MMLKEMEALESMIKGLLVVQWLRIHLPMVDTGLIPGWGNRDHSHVSTSLCPPAKEPVSLGALEQPNK